MIATRDIFEVTGFSNIGIWLQDTEQNRWTNISIPLKQWYAEPNQPYTIKFAVKKYSNQITKICWGSMIVYIQNPKFFKDVSESSCSKWIDPIIPSFVAELYVEGTPKFEMDYK